MPSPSFSSFLYVSMVPNMGRTGYRRKGQFSCATEHNEYAGIRSTHRRRRARHHGSQIARRHAPHALLLLLHRCRYSVCGGKRCVSRDARGLKPAGATGDVLTPLTVVWWRCAPSPLSARAPSRVTSCSDAAVEGAGAAKGTAVAVSGNGAELSGGAAFGRLKLQGKRRGVKHRRSGNSLGSTECTNRASRRYRYGMGRAHSLQGAQGRQRQPRSRRDGFR